MNDRDRLDERWLRSLDDLQLEGVRYDLLRSGDRRAEHVAEHLLVRGLGHIERLVSELGTPRGLSAVQLRDATIDASVRLQLRLSRTEKLPAIEILAGRLAHASVQGFEPAEPALPRLVARAPRLRTIQGALSDSLLRGRLKPNQGSDS